MYVNYLLKTNNIKTIENSRIKPRWAFTLFSILRLLTSLVLSLNDYQLIIFEEFLRLKLTYIQI